MRYLIDLANGNPGGFGLLALFATWALWLVLSDNYEIEQSPNESEDRHA
jgi:hypothetical protein